jgi:magnesium transporter
MVAGFWGMNFTFMPVTEWHFGFYAVIAGTVAACVLLYVLFRRSGWL